MSKYFFSIVLLLGLIFSCHPSSQNNKPDALTSHVDTTVNPADDFFDFANGGWIKNNPIPGDETRYGIGQLVINETQERLKIINENAAAANDKKGSTSQKIGDFWKMAMDSAKIEQEGIKPIQALLQKVDAVQDKKQLTTLIAELKIVGVYTFFDDYITQDDKKSDVMAYKLYQGGLGLPEREYYVSKEASIVNIRNNYEQYIKKMLVLISEPDADASKSAKSILEMETKLAVASRKMEDLRNPYTNYNKMSLATLCKMNTQLDWNQYLLASKIQKIDSVIVGQPEFFKAMDQVMAKTDLSVLKEYMKFKIVNEYAATLPERFGVASFEFSKLLSGAKARKVRWKRVLSMEESKFGELLGQLYVKEYFDESAKKRYSNQIDLIKNALKSRIEKLTWMSDSTKQKAYKKLATMKKKVGYPDRWKDYSKMEIGTVSYTQNVINANTWLYHEAVNKLGKPVDRDEWGMSPQTYNAYYNPSNNEIVIPAGIVVVPGYDDKTLDDALVFGYVAASTIGHEITHGFDDEGRQFDEKGNLSNWWTKQDGEEFTKRSERMVQQFSAIEPIKGFHINGKASLGENIADLGGVLLGLDAFKQTEQYKKGEKVAGYTPLQRYFMGYALGWMNTQREEALKNQLMSDVHAPAKYRVNAIFSNVDEFYTAFGVKPTHKMYVPDSLRVRIW